MKTTQIKQDQDNTKEEEVNQILSLIVSSTTCSKRNCELILMFVFCKIPSGILLCIQL